MNRILTTLIAFMASTALTQAQDVWERPDAPQTEKTQKKEKRRRLQRSAKMPSILKER